MAADGVELVALFSPEHGIRGEAEGGIGIESQTDERTGLPIHSLYGETRKPTPEMLEGLDVLLFDIQDVGARYYTYVSTMARAMEAAGEAGIPFMVLDRPNPIGGMAVQGTVLDPAFRHLRGTLPRAHAARHDPRRAGTALCRGVRHPGGAEGGSRGGLDRDMPFEETGLPWVPPSPNMPSVESAFHYPGTCLFEGTNISVGRGTDMAFQVVGAPWFDPETLAAAMVSYQLEDVEIRTFQLHPREPWRRKIRRAGDPRGPARRHGSRLRSDPGRPGSSFGDPATVR